MTPTPGSATAGSSSSGGGSGGSDTGVQQTFSVDLVGIDARRISNGSRVAVDTSGVTSGQLTLTQEP